MTVNIRNCIASLVFLCLLINKADAVGFTLTINVVGSGSVTRNPTNATYPSGATVTLTAISNDPTWFFANWSGDNTGTNNPMNVTMNSNKVITATFQQFNTFTLALITNGQGTITLSPTGGVYSSNTTVNATATPAAGWVFTAWSGAVNGNSNPTPVTMTTNKTLTGNFAQLPAFNIQPQTVSTQLGANISFSSHSVGTATVSYQWYFSGSAVPGATGSSLSLTNVQLANAGNYYVVAANNYGSATSSIAALVLTNAIVSTNALLVCDEGSLRAAIQVGGRIGVACNGTIALTNTINITTNVTLDASKVSLVVSGNYTNRVFYVAPGVTFSATNLVIANGCVSNNLAEGAGFYNDNGTVDLTYCLLTNNFVKSYTMAPTTITYARGGAMYSRGGTVRLTGSSFSNNVAGGVLYDTTTRFEAKGAGLYISNSTVTIINCNFNNNQCTSLSTPFGQEGGTSCGGAVYQVFSYLSITNSSFFSNVAFGGPGGQPSYTDGSGYGGALYADCIASVDHCCFAGNLSHGGNAAKFPKSGYGGAIFNHFILTVESSSFYNNQALAGGSTELGDATGQGGAIFNTNNMTLNRCSIYSNSAAGSPGIQFGSIPEPGGPGYGGGIFNAGQIVATNCSIALNSAVAGAGWGIVGPTGSSRANNGDAVGGGIYNAAGSTSVWMNVTIADNYSVKSPPGSLGTNGFAAGYEVGNSNGVVRLHNSIVAYSGTNANVYGTVTDDGFNISDDGSAAFSGGASYNFTDPRLGTLGTAPGLTPTMPLLSNSPAIDFGDSSGAPSTDQRGYARPNGDGYDIGAYEYYAFSTPQATFGRSGTNFAMTFTAYPPVTYRLQFSTNMVSWTDLETNGPFASVTNLSRTINKQAGNRFYRIFCQ